MLDALVARTGIDPAAIDDVIVGCVSQIGEQAFTSAATWCSPPNCRDTCPAVTIDRQCGSSQQAIHFAAQAVMAGTQDVVIAAGVESMTRVPMGTPMLLPMQAGIGTPVAGERSADRYGVSEFSQFIGAEMMAEKYGLHPRAARRVRARQPPRPPRRPKPEHSTDEIVPLEGRRRRQ